MSPHRATPAAETTPGTTLPPSPGFDAAWHPVLGRMLHGQHRRQLLDRRHPWLLDTAVVLVVALLSLPDLLTDDRDGGPFGEAEHRSDLPVTVQVAFAAALVIPLWWRRRAPAATYFVIAAVSLVQWSLDLWQQAGVSMLVALYSLALHGSLRVLGWAVAVTVGELALAVWLLGQVEHPLLGLFFLLGTATAAVTLGLTLRIRRMYLATLEDRATRLEIERDQRVRLTAAAERSRVAREMHDIVGHNLSVMVGLADGAATLAAHNNERSAEALRLLGDTGQAGHGRTPPRPGRPAGGPGRPGRRTAARPAAGHPRPGPPAGTGPRGGPARHLPDRGRSRRAGQRRTAHRVPHRPGGPDQHPQARRYGLRGRGRRDRRGRHRTRPGHRHRRPRGDTPPRGAGAGDRPPGARPGRYQAAGRHVRRHRRHRPPRHRPRLDRRRPAGRTPAPPTVPASGDHLP